MKLKLIINYVELDFINNLLIFVDFLIILSSVLFFGPVISLFFAKFDIKSLAPLHMFVLSVTQ